MMKNPPPSILFLSELFEAIVNVTNSFKNRQHMHPFLRMQE